jgi:hypothetical protein
MKTSFKILSLALFLFMGFVGVNYATDSTPVATVFVIGLGAASLIAKPSGAFFATGIDVDDLKEAFGAYYINAGQNMKRLMNKIRETTVLQSYAKPIITTDTTFRAGNTTMTEVIQAFQKTWTAKGKQTIRPVENKLYNIKADIELYPDEIVASWAGFLDSIDENDRSKWPLIRYMLEMDVAPQIQEDLEMKAHYNGEYEEPVDGEPGAAQKSMNGVRKIVQLGLDNEKQPISPLALGAITNSNIFDKVEETMDIIPKVLTRKPGGLLFMSENNRLAYLRKRRDLYGDNVDYKADKNHPDYFTNVEIVGIPGIENEQDIIFVHRNNFLHIKRGTLQYNKPPKIETLKRQVFLMTDWWEGFGFHYNEMVFAQLGTETSGSGSASGGGSGSGSASGS